MELAVVKHIKEFGLEKTCEKFKLKCKDYGHKIILKYDQISSDFSYEEVRESRGLVLEKGTWKVMSMAFYKFFNAGEQYAANINWDRAYIYEKMDGSLCNLHFDWVKNKWCIATTGTAEGEGEVNERPNTSFADLFFETLKNRNYFDLKNLNTKNVYMFELCTPYNIVVKPHTESALTLLAIRNLETMKEYDREMLEYNFSKIAVKCYSFGESSVQKLQKTFENMQFSEEGYVVCDSNFNRIKIKNPKYVSAHFLKSKTSAYAIMDIVKYNEIEEFSATFPERKEEIFMLKENYDNLIVKLDDVWDILKEMKPKNITKPEQKKFAMNVFKVAKENDVEVFTGLFFSLKDYKVEDVKTFIQEYDNKKLYDLLSV